jgi:hypothetical protein
VEEEVDTEDPTIDHHDTKTVTGNKNVYRMKSTTLRSVWEVSSFVLETRYSINHPLATISLNRLGTP